VIAEAHHAAVVGQPVTNTPVTPLHVRCRCEAFSWGLSVPSSDTSQVPTWAPGEVPPSPQLLTTEALPRATGRYCRPGPSRRSRLSGSSIGCHPVRRPVLDPVSISSRPFLPLFAVSPPRRNCPGEVPTLDTRYDKCRVLLDAMIVVSTSPRDEGRSAGCPVGFVGGRASIAPSFSITAKRNYPCGIRCPSASPHSTATIHRALPPCGDQVPLHV
jgi:hypothetical protein